MTENFSEQAQTMYAKLERDKSLDATTPDGASLTIRLKHEHGLRGYSVNGSKYRIMRRETVLNWLENLDYRQ